MRLIHEHGARGMSIKELLQLIPVSRKWLDLQFKELIGHTPSQEIRRLRLTHIRDLLVNTDLSIRQISRRCNFGSFDTPRGFHRNSFASRHFADGKGDGGALAKFRRHES